jgi:hypothetical protein
MSLVTIAKNYSENPSSIDAMTDFIDALAQEASIDAIRGTLSFDYEKITGLSLSRLIELLPDNVDLLLSFALWKYQFGLDDDAHRYLEQAKCIAPFDQNVLQVEVFMNYDQPPDYILSLCESALFASPNNEWLINIKQTIEKTGQLTELSSPPLNLRF